MVAISKIVSLSATLLAISLTTVASQPQSACAEEIALISQCVTAQVQASTTLKSGGEKQLVLDVLKQIEDDCKGSPVGDTCSIYTPQNSMKILNCSQRLISQSSLTATFKKDDAITVFDVSSLIRRLVHLLRIVRSFVTSRPTTKTQHLFSRVTVITAKEQVEGPSLFEEDISEDLDKIIEIIVQMNKLGIIDSARNIRNQPQQEDPGSLQVIEYDQPLPAQTLIPLGQRN
ncbi:hypothetical protein BGZ49_005420 [Haplosporangium sp. Z 27]|nr:hypothetical protein BGZ49_005420 [Haplosporangium sp. Z 27]